MPTPEPAKPVVLPKFEIVVGEPIRVGGLDAHTSYRIRTKVEIDYFRQIDGTVD
jgi:hypothetical protein